MCGIYAYLRASLEKLDPETIEKVKTAGNLIQHRGPDITKILLVSDQLFFGFHRLAINGLDHESDEPLVSQDRRVTLICNGEIYNCHELVEEYQLPVITHNDCEVIIYLYQKYGIAKTVRMLDGVFAFILHDRNEETGDVIYVANDPFGVRPLYQGIGKNGDLAWASEPIALRDICPFGVSFFPPGHYQKIVPSSPANGAITDTESFASNWVMSQRVVPYFQYNWEKKFIVQPFMGICEEVRRLLEKSVQRRLMSDRPIACLLSGGLDSSLVSSLVAQFLAERGEKLHTFSIGMPGSPDLAFAQKVAEHIGSEHHHVEISETDFLNAIPEVIRATQTWDITTIRASVGNYLIAKYISQKTDFKVIFNGDGSEEIWASYYYSRFAPNDIAFYLDNVKLLREIHRYDVLRSARCVEHWGLEARTPFLDQDLVNFVMSIHPKYKRFGQPGSEFQLEKTLMRIACQDLLPQEVLWRPKTAFSDGVSNKARSWHQIVSEYMDGLVSDQEYATGHQAFKNLGIEAPSKEAYFYQSIFLDQMGERSDMILMIKEYWMPRFIKATDPSAREIGGS